MRNILTAIAVLAIATAAQTSKPAKAFELWKPTEVGKDRSADVTVVYKPRPAPTGKDS